MAFVVDEGATDAVVFVDDEDEIDAVEGDKDWEWFNDVAARSTSGAVYL